jgi:hypothetical protein
MALCGQCVNCGVRWYYTGDEDVPECRCGHRPGSEDVVLADRIIREQAFRMRAAHRSGLKAPKPDWFFLAR